MRNPRRWPSLSDTNEKLQNWRDAVVQSAAQLLHRGSTL
jgi:hypothetical protein